MNLQTRPPSIERSAFRAASIYAIATFLLMALIELVFYFPFEHQSLAREFTEDHEWIFILGSVVIVYFAVRAQILKHLRESRELLKTGRDYRHVVELAQEGICAVDAEWKVRYFNTRMAEMLGCTAKEAVGRSIYDFVRDDAKKSVEEYFGQIRKGVSDLHEITLSKKDGSSVDAAIIASPMMSDDGRFEGAMAVVMDMTERKSLQKELAEYEVRFGKMLENVRLMAILMDLNGNVTFVNDFLLETTGYGREEVVGRNWFDLFIPEESRDEIRRVFSTFMRNGGETHTHNENSIRIKNGESRRISWYHTLLRDHDGKPIGHTAIGEDVTEKKRAEAALLESENKYRSLFETANDAIFVADAETGILIDVNKQGETLIGKSREEIIGAHQTTLHPSEEAAAYSAEFKEHMSGGKRLSSNIFVRHKDGRKIPVDIRSGHFRLGGRLVIFGIFHDMTNRNRAEDALRRKTELARLLQEVSIAANEAVRVDDAMLICLEKICGYTGWEIGHVYLLGGDKVLRSAPIWSLRDGKYEELRQVTALTTFVSGAGLPGRALSTGKPAWILDITKDVNFYRTESLKSLGMKSCFAFPILVKKDIVAVMEFFTKQMDEPDEHLLGAINSLTTQIGRVVERKEMEERLQLTHRVIESAVEGIIITDPDGVILSVNPAFRSITGYEAADVIGKKPSVLKSGRHDDEFYNEMWTALKSTGKWEGEIWNRRKNGEIYPEWLSITSIRDFSGRTTQYAAMFNDISEYKRSQREVEYQAYHDALTGLPNRTLFIDRLKQAVMRAKRSHKMVAMMFLDLDNFKQVNDSMGHPMGDLLLKGMAIRLISSLRESDTASRFGGDEFAVFLEEIANDYEIVETARRIVENLVEPYHLKEEGELSVTVSVGITVFPQDGDDVTKLLKNADMAMYHAKASGKNNYQFFTPAMNEKFSTRLALESKLRKAIERRELLLHYQPKVSIITGRVSGMEALLRWRQPGGSLIPPSAFIPLAEESGFIVTLDEWVLRTACAFIKRINETITPMLSMAVNVSVNLSARDLERSDIVESVSAAVAESGLSPGTLELELTESTIIKNLDMAGGILRDLRESGFNISIDDFGTGYSSLNYITKLPINALKLDRSLITDLPVNPSAKSVARAITSMAHELGVKIIAEGVETREQLDFLCSIRCDEIQGYLFSKPLPEDEVESLLKENRVFPRG